LSPEARAHSRCGIDIVDVARIERLLRDTPQEGLLQVFSAEELRDAGEGPARPARLAARFAAKEACLKLFPRETALGLIGPADFAVVHDGYGAPHVRCSARAANALGRHRLDGIALSLSHDHTHATAVAIAEPGQTATPLVGKLLYHLLPIRRRVMHANLRRVFGDSVPDAEITRLAQAHYAHLARCAVEIIGFSWLPAPARAAFVRVENKEACIRAHARGKGVLLLTGHFGNWEIATVGGIAQFPEYRGQFHFVRRALHPRWLDDLVARRFRTAGLGVLPRRGTLDAVLDRLAAGDTVVFPFDQHAANRDGVGVDFFGHPASTSRSLALLALTSGAAVVPASSWRESPGRHVLRFEAALPLIEHDDPDAAIRLNTRAYNAALEGLVLRHPQQWFWLHRRWKDPSTAPAKTS